MNDDDEPSRLELLLECFFDAANSVQNNGELAFSLGGKKKARE